MDALRLSLAFAMTGGNIDRHCLEYQTHVMSTVRGRLHPTDTALTLPTLGAILLLAGIEVGRSLDISVRIKAHTEWLTMKHSRLG